MNTNGNVIFSKLQSLAQVSLTAVEKLSLMHAQSVKFPGPGKKIANFVKHLIMSLTYDGGTSSEAGREVHEAI